LRNLYIHDIGYDQSPGCCCNECYSYGIYWGGSQALLENSRFENISGYAIHGYTTVSGGASANIIRNNVFRKTGMQLLICQSQNRIEGNILDGVGIGAKDNNGIQLARFCSGQASDNNIIVNNTITGSKSNCIDLGESRGTTVTNNICWKNGSDVISGGSGPRVSHNLLGKDPLFVNAGAGDFRLQAASPAVDAGASGGDRAFTGAGPDAGACELGVQSCPVGSGSPTTPPSPGVAAPKNLRLVSP
jgi:parallel beta-helix repeat protein